MNLLMIVVLVIFALFIFIGYKRGLFRSVFKLAITIVSMVVAYLLAPLVTDFVINNTTMDDKVDEKVYEVIRTIAQNRLKDEMLSYSGDMDSEVLEQLTDIALSVEPTRSQQIDIIQRIHLPQFLSDAIIANNNEEVRQELGADGFYEYLACYIGKMIINAIAFAVTFVLVLIIANIVYFAAGIVSKLPIIGGIDRFGGIAFGIIEALLVVWIMFIVITIFANTSFGSDLFNQINDNGFLSFLYDKNVLNSSLTRLGR